MGRGGLTPPPLQTAPGCGGQWCWSVFFSLPSSQRERKRSHQRGKSLARNHQSQESRVNVTWAHQNLLHKTPRSTRALENAPVGGTSRGTTALAARRALGPCSAGSQCTSSATRSRTWAVLGCATTSTHSLGRATRVSLTTPTRTARGATRTVGSASRTRSLDQTRRREAAAKQGRTRSTVRPSKETANTSATVIPTQLARRRPMSESLDSTGSANATRDGLATGSNVWIAMEISVPHLTKKLRSHLHWAMQSMITSLLSLAMGMRWRNF